MSCEDVMMVLVYVDDVIFTSSNLAKPKQFVSDMNRQFSLKDMGYFSYFIGIKVFFSSYGWQISQAKYIKSLLDRFDMASSKVALTPMVSRGALRKQNGIIL